MNSSSNQETNLLNQRQVLSSYKDLGQDDRYEECVRINTNLTKSIVYSKKFLDPEVDRKCEEIKIELANVQLAESVPNQQHKSLCDRNETIERFLEHLLHYLESTILDLKSSQRLAIQLNSLALGQDLITESISSKIRNLCTPPILSNLEDLRTKIFVCLNGYDNVKILQKEFEQRKHDFDLALKNFKIILEVMNVKPKGLADLKRQFEDVLMNLQHSRCIVSQELPVVMEERLTVIKESFEVLGEDMEVWGNRKVEFGKLCKELCAKMD